MESELHPLACFSSAGTPDNVHRPAMSVKVVHPESLFAIKNLTISRLRKCLVCQMLGSGGVALSYSFLRGYIMLCENRVGLRDKNVCENMICCPFFVSGLFLARSQGQQANSKAVSREA